MKWHKYRLCFLFLYTWSLCLQAELLYGCDTLRVSGNPEYPPLLWPDIKSPDTLTGAVPEFLGEVVEPLGIKVNVRNTGSWARVQRLAELGEIDLVAGAFITAERLGYLDYVLPPMIHLDTNVWVPRQRMFEYRHWPDLEGKQGSTLIDNSFGERFDSFAADHLDILGVRSIRQSYLMADIGRIDYVLYELLQGRAKLARYGMSNDFVALEPPVSREGLFFAFPKLSRCNSKALREAFAARLLELTEQGRLEELIEEYLIRYTEEGR